MPRCMSRRTLLRAAGACVALPLLDAMVPIGRCRLHAAEGAAASAPRRFVGLYMGAGVCNEAWYPKDEGANYTLPPTLEPLKDLTAQFALVSGLHHPQGLENHKCQGCWLTGVDYTKKPTISLDQVLAEQLGKVTRYPSLQLGDANGVTAASSSISWTREGVPLPHVQNPMTVYQRLFVPPDATSKEAARRRIAEQRSVLDEVLAEAKAIAGEVGAEDRARLEQYFASVRETETMLRQQEAFVDKPLPAVDKAELSSELQGEAANVRAMYALLYHALVSDQTRIAVWALRRELNSVVMPHLGFGDNHHALTHHGGDKAKLEKIARFDRFYAEELARFLRRLHEAKDADGASMLDRTVVLYGHGLNNGIRFENGTGNHACKNLALLVAGGKGLGLKPGRHLRFPGDQVPMNNLHLTFLKAFGLPAERFNDGTATIAGLA